MRGDRGSAVVEFVAVVPLVLLVGLTVLQFALLAHSRAVLGAAAAEAARAAALSDNPATAARATADDVVSDALGDVPVTHFRVQRGSEAGLPVVTVELSARPNLALLPDILEVTGRGHSLVEPGL